MTAVHSSASQVIDLYDRFADAWHAERGHDLIVERQWIDLFVSQLPAGAAILDLGCGSGQPIAAWLLRRGFDVVGVDASAQMIARCRARFPDREWLVADMRSLAIDRTFAGIIGWDSFFHLSPADQRAMFPVFSQHSAAGTLLMFTSGPAHGETIGEWQGRALYHASLAATEYRHLLMSHGFEVIAHRERDPDCGYHTVWLARAGSPDHQGGVSCCVWPPVEQA